MCKKNVQIVPKTHHSPVAGAVTAGAGAGAGPGAGAGAKRHEAWGKRHEV